MMSLVVQLAQEHHDKLNTLEHTNYSGHKTMSPLVTIAMVGSKKVNIPQSCLLQMNGPYSLLVRASYFISYSVYARSTSVILSFANGAGGVGVFLTSCISMPCSEAIRLIIR